MLGVSRVKLYITITEGEQKKKKSLETNERKRDRHFQQINKSYERRKKSPKG